MDFCGATRKTSRTNSSGDATIRCGVSARWSTVDHVAPPSRGPADLPADDRREQLASAAGRDLARQPADLAAVVPAAAAVGADADACRCGRRCRARPCSARSAGRRTSCRAGARTAPPLVETNVPCSVETAHCCGVAGLTTTSIGAAGGVRVSQRRAAVAGDLDVRRLGVDGEDLLRRRSRARGSRPRGPWTRCQVSPWSLERIRPRFSGSAPSCGWPEASRSPGPVKRTTRLPGDGACPAAAGPGELLGLLGARRRGGTARGRCRP